MFRLNSDVYYRLVAPIENDVCMEYRFRQPPSYDFQRYPPYATMRAIVDDSIARKIFDDTDNKYLDDYKRLIRTINPLMMECFYDIVMSDDWEVFEAVNFNKELPWYGPHNQCCIQIPTKTMKELESKGLSFTDVAAVRSAYHEGLNFPCSSALLGFIYYMRSCYIVNSEAQRKLGIWKTAFRGFPNQILGPKSIWQSAKQIETVVGQDFELGIRGLLRRTVSKTYEQLVVPNPPNGEESSTTSTINIKLTPLSIQTTIARAPLFLPSVIPRSPVGSPNGDSTPLIGMPPTQQVQPTVVQTLPRTSSNAVPKNVDTRNAVVTTTASHATSSNPSYYTTSNNGIAVSQVMSTLPIVFSDSTSALQVLANVAAIDDLAKKIDNLHIATDQRTQTTDALNAIPLNIPSAGSIFALICNLHGVDPETTNELPLHPTMETNRLPLTEKLKERTIQFHQMTNTTPIKGAEKYLILRQLPDPSAAEDDDSSDEESDDSDDDNDSCSSCSSTGSLHLDKNLDQDECTQDEWIDYIFDKINAQYRMELQRSAMEARIEKGGEFLTRQDKDQLFIYCTERMPREYADLIRIFRSMYENYIKQNKLKQQQLVQIAFAHVEKRNKWIMEKGLQKVHQYIYEMHLLFLRYVNKFPVLASVLCFLHQHRNSEHISTLEFMMLRYYFQELPENSIEAIMEQWEINVAKIQQERQQREEESNYKPFRGWW